jgi:hypothetical protein
LIGCDKSAGTLANAIIGPDQVSGFDVAGKAG